MSKKSCKETDVGKTSELKLAKCSHCGAKQWNILGESMMGYVLTYEEEKGVRTCLLREKGTAKALTAPCELDDSPKGANYTTFQLQFASAADIATMSSPGARLVTAASEGDKKTIQSMLKDGVDINSRDWDQISAILPSASTGNLDLVKFLVKEGIDVNAGDKDGISALMEAAIMGHIKVVEFLIDNGAEVDLPSKTGVTALWLAASQGKIECMKYLIKKGADPSITRSDGMTALMTASVGGHAEAVKLLLEAGADPTASDGEGVTPLMSSSETGALEVVKLLVDHTKDDKSYLNTISTTGFTALIIASAQGHAEVIDYLLENGADANLASDSQVNALMYAASGNHVEALKSLLDKGKAHIDAKHTNGGTALLEASTSGSAESIKLLIEHGAAVDEADADGVTLLMAVGSHPNKEAHRIVLDALKKKYSGKQLVDHINMFSFSGGSSAMFAAAAGNTELMKELIDLGADVTAVAKATPEYLGKIKKSVEDGTFQGDDPHVEGLTALHVAAQAGYLSTVEALLEQKVAVNVKDAEGRTPLSLAIKNNHADVATLLVQNGADPSTLLKDENGVDHNLLFDAVMVENVDFAGALIENGADIYYKDEKSVTTLLQACHRGLSEITKLLLDKHKANGKSGFVNDASDEGICPLIAAASEGHLEVVKLLIEAKADLDAKDKDETTALMAAAARGHAGIVKELVAAGAKINEQNRDGHTALMFAYNGKNQVETLWERYSQFASDAEPGADDGGTGPIIREALDNHTALVDVLLKSGADPKLKDKEGHVAKDFDYHPDTDNELLEKEVKKEAARDESRNEL